MPYEVFEGKKKVRKVKYKRDSDDFDYAKRRFGFIDEIDLVSFCAAIALLKEHQGSSLTKENPSLKEMAMMQSFRKAELYDRIILDYLDVAEDRLLEFEKYFYVGFKFLRDWLDEYGPDLNNEIELICQICGDLSE